MSVIAYEQRRIRTLRSTWIIIVLTLILAGGLTAAFAALANLDPQTGERSGLGQLTDALSTITSPIVLVPLSVLAAMAFGAEYRFGLIRLTLTAFPRRTSVFFAKMWVVLLWMLVSLLLALAVVLAVAWIFRANVDFQPLVASNLWYMLRAVGYALGYCLFAFALVLMTRNQALAIVLLLLWAVVVEGVLVSLLGSKFEWLPKVLPFNAGTGFVQGKDMLVNGLVFLAYLVVFLLIGWILLLRRDA